jgi:AcrR family transcriptional regulator
MSKKMDRRVKRTKQALREALFSIMSEKDFKSISITEIVERAGYNRSTFYAHYSSKEDLLNEIIEEKSSNLMDAIRGPYLENEVIYMDTIHPSAIQLFEHISSNAIYYKLMLNQNILPGFQERFCEAIKQHILKYITEFANTNHDIDPEIHAYFCAYATLGMVRFWLESGSKYTPLYMAKQLTEIFGNHLRKVRYSGTNYFKDHDLLRKRFFKRV